MDILKQGYPDIDDAQLEEVLREADGDVFEALDVLRIGFGEPGIGKLFSRNEADQKTAALAKRPKSLNQNHRNRRSYRGSRCGRRMRKQKM